MRAADTSPSTSHRGSAGLAGLLRWTPVALLGGLLLAGRRRGEWFAGDEAYYVGLARSLGGLRGYVFDGAPHAIYPPGFPAALVPAVRLRGVDPPALILYTVCLGLVAVAGVGVYLRSRGDVDRIALHLALLLGSVAVFDVFTDLRSETLFLLLWALLFALLEWAGRGRDRETGPPAGPARTAGAAVVAAALAGLAAGIALPATRSVGVVLVAALPAAALAWWARRRTGRPASAPSPRWGAAVAGAWVGATAYQLAWMRWERLYGEERSYMNLLAMADPHRPDLGTVAPLQVMLRVLDRAGVQLGRIAEVLTNGPQLQPFLTGLPQVLAAAALVWGLRREFRRSDTVAGWFLAVYLVVVVLWPFDEGTRFLVPVLPLLFLFAGRGAVDLLEAWPAHERGWRRVAAVALACMVGVGVEQVVRRDLAVQGLLWMALWAGVAAVAFGAAPRLAAWRPRPRPRRWATAWAAAFLLLGAPQLLGQAARQRAGEEKFQAARIAGAVAWVRESTEPWTPLASTAEAQGVHLHSGRPVARMPTTGDAERLWAVADAAEARYLVVPIAHEYPYLRPTGDERVEAMERARPGRLRLVHTYEMGRIFEVRPP